MTNEYTNSRDKININFVILKNSQHWQLFFVTKTFLKNILRFVSKGRLCIGEKTPVNASMKVASIGRQEKMLSYNIWNVLYMYPCNMCKRFRY